ncbi:MAG: hypothetical protein ACI9ND_001948 [Yoonia sp.]|jgi:hypothetical protein
MIVSEKFVFHTDIEKYLGFLCTTIYALLLSYLSYIYLDRCARQNYSTTIYSSLYRVEEWLVP